MKYPITSAIAYTLLIMATGLGQVFGSEGQDQLVASFERMLNNQPGQSVEDVDSSRHRQ